MSKNETARDRVDRRTAVKTGASVGIGAAFLLRMGRLRRAQAAKNDMLQVGLVGCGKRGTGAAGQAIEASPNTRLVAMGDLFPDHLQRGQKTLGTHKHAERLQVDQARAFTGWDAYQKVIESDVDYVVLATPPGFRPLQLEAAVAAGKNVFMEKPIAVDGPGIRAVLAAGEEAQKKRLGVGVGLQRRHHTGYQQMMKQIHAGAIGPIVAARCYWMQGALWMKPREPSWSDMEWQLRNWLYFTWLSGDHINEQHIHNIDVVNWATGRHPVAAVAVGGRQQRTQAAFGHIYDHFAVDYEYPDDVHVLSMCRQMPLCANDVSEHLIGTRGRAHADNRSFTIEGKRKWAFAGEPNPYVQEHADLIDSILRGKPLNEVKSAAESNLAAIMGRMAGYSGKRITWEQALHSQESLMPEKLAFGPLKTAAVAVPGRTELI